MDEFEVQLEFTIKSDLNEAFGFYAILTKDEFREEDLTKSWLGYRTDYPGIGVYVIMNKTTKKWHVVTL